MILVRRKIWSRFGWGVLIAAVLFFSLQGCGKGITVTLSANPAQSAVLTGSGSYSQGAEVTVKAEPAPGWEFVRWTLDREVVATTEEYSFIVQGRTELMAHLRPLTFSIETHVRGGGTVVSPADTAQYGDSVTLEAIPDPGFRFAQWEEAGAAVSNQAVYTFSVEAARELTAVFVPSEYSLKLQVDGQGGHVVESWSLDPAQVTLEAIARQGYEFFSWVDLETQQEIETKAVVTLAWKGPRKIMARFRPELIAVDGSSLTAVVGKHSTLGEYEPADLVELPGHLTGGKERRVRREVAEALESLYQAAAADGVKIVVSSAYRSYQTQQRIFYRYVSDDGIFEAERYSARPGQSEHQLGTAVDFGGTNKDYSSAYINTAPGAWLYENAHRFGFALSYPRDSEEITGYIYEPWHYRYIGVELAQQWKESGFTLIEFLEKLNQAN